MSTMTEMLQNEQIVHETSTARKINNLLNSSETRIEGLQLLNLFLHQCSDEDFLQFCISWMQNCCKTDVLTKNRDFAVYLLSKLFKISSNYQELKKSVSFFITTRYFDYFFKNLLNSHAGWCCTESCLLHYRGACGSFQVALEKHLKKEVQKNVEISPIVGGCFALIPCIGGGGNEGESHIKNWKIQFVHFLNVCHSIMNNLFVNVEEFQEYENLDNSYKKESSYKFLTIQLKNHLMVLNCMLLNKYPAPKNVPSDLIFRLVCRGLVLNSKALAKPKTSSIISLEKVLPEIQCSLLSLLKALICTCKNQLLPYSLLTCKLIKQILERTENDFTSGNNRFWSLRILAYETLCEWLVAARSGSCVEVVSSAIISNAVADIRSKKKVVSLKETKFRTRVKETDQARTWINGTADSRLCQAALKALQFLLKFAGVFLKPEEHKFLQEVVVKLVTEVQKNSASDVPVSFEASACRTELYRTLLELICHPCPNWPPPTNYALRLFGEGTNDPSCEVSSLCLSALNFLTIIIHPQYDNGGFPLSEATGTPNVPNQTEMEPQWRETLLALENKEGEIGLEETTEIGEKHFQCDERDKSLKSKGFRDESDITSDEDSRNTVKFIEDSVEPDTKVNETDTNKVLAQIHQMNEEPHSKKPKMSTGEPATESIPSPAKESPIKSSKMNKLVKNTHPENFINSKSDSPESVNGEGPSTARYYLRSKTKASSEEPEDATKKISSPVVLKNTFTKSLAKDTPVVESGKKRPRTRALSRVMTSSEKEVKTPEKSSAEDDDGDEEGIKAAFNDSFVD